MKFILLFSLVFNDLSIWWLFPCIVLGLAYAWLFYQKSPIDKPFLKNILFAFRSVAVILLGLLLLSPLVKTVKEKLQKPVVFIAQDASASISLNKSKDFDSVAYHQNLKKLQASLAEDYDVKTISFDDQVKTGFNFKESGKQTDISSVFDFVATQNLDNVGAIVIATDGVYNKGANPVTQIGKVKFPVYSIALGDTIPKKDLVLMQPVYNQLVYLGDSHQVEITVKAFAAKGLQSVLKVSTNDGQFKQQNVTFSNTEETKTFKFALDAKKKGIQKITFSLSPIANEISIENNRQTIYVEVIDGSEKILIAADAPHPDLGALKQAIETNKNYKVILAFADNLPAKTDDYGLIILHNLPSVTHPITDFLQRILQKSKWFIVGTQTNVVALSTRQTLMDLSPSNQIQNYSASLNPDFYAFSLSENTKTNLQNLAPLSAPFSGYQLKSAGKILFKQQIGNVKTASPLLVFQDNANYKTAVLTGEGIWRWRIDDFSKNNNFDAFDELITKSVQYLNTKNDKRKFRVKSNKNRYFENENILLTAELYNDAYELINEPEVNLEIKTKQGRSYSFLFSRTQNAYELNTGALPAGEYDFMAKTKLGNKNYTAPGSFLVEALNIELMETQANHQLLYNLGETTGGAMVDPNWMLTLVDAIKTNEKVKTISYQQKSYDPLINLKWIFALIVLLLSFEWFLRKRNGAI